MSFLKILKWIIFLVRRLLLYTNYLTAINFSPKVDGDGRTEKPSKKIVIFFDGTANDPNSDTNIKQLHSLVSLQNRDDIATSYIKGVGASGEILGMAMGWGIGFDVREAYEFLLKTYNPKDEIYIFGFSRGAYASRILSAILYYGGIPKIDPIMKDDVDTFDYRSLTEDIYGAYKGDKKREQRREEILKVLKNIQHMNIDKIGPVPVEVLGLWDTVEALGIPNYEENIDIPNTKYGDQLCNVNNAYQALSIDDNRANIFTPILITRKHLYHACKEWDEQKKEEHQKNHVKEVYFSGAHADVGGGYDNNYLNGVSLNWMISNIKDTGIIPKNASVKQNMYAKTHNAENGLLWGLIYGEKNRSIHDYINKKFRGEDASYEKKLNIHESVFQRLEEIKIEDHDYKWLEHYDNCFEKKGDNEKYLKYKGNEECQGLNVVFNEK